MKLSIIMPIYCVEEYVERALNSCLDQDLDSSEYEIIIVNDGTPDGSMAIVERIAQKHDNIRIVEQENQGLSVARNAGLAVAEGDYVWFVDSDDWIAKDSLSQIVQRLDERNLDALLITAATTDGERSERSADRSSLEGRVFKGREIVYRMPIEMHAQYTIYRRSLLLESHLEFMPGIYHEDNEFTPRAYYYINRMMVWNEVVYYLYQRPQSITHMVNPKRSYDLLTVARSLAIFANRVDRKYLKHLYKCIAVSINTSMLCATSYDAEQRAKYSKVLAYNKRLFSYFFLSRRVNFMVEGVLFMLFPKRALSIYESFNNMFYHRK